MASKADIRAAAARYLDGFTAAGADIVEADILQPAEALLDLYGEDIRARAYVTQDPLRGEQMLRPDFTVPVVQMHMADGAAPARYTYIGEVFRRQETETGRPSEYMQVGYEVFDRDAPEAAAAEVFALIVNALAPLNVRAVTGDIGILKAAIAGLNTSARRKAALSRHIWRPRRFRALLDRFGGRTEIPAARAALLTASDPMRTDVPLTGLRTRTQIAERISALQHEASQPPIPEGEMALIDTILELRETAPNVLIALRDIAVDLPELRPSVERMALRLDALAARGIDVDTLEFDAGYGRTALEYYDGFVFGFYAAKRPELPPVATGGRYDALTRVLGQGREIPAVGGVIRPGIALEIAP